MNLGILKKPVDIVMKKAVKYSPELKLGLGIACIVGGAVVACLASRKVDGVLETADQNLEKIHSDAKNGLTDDRTTHRALAWEYARICWDMVKLYGPAALMIGGGIVSICSSHVEMKGRNSALAASCASLSNAYNLYREKIIEVLGPEEEEKIRLGIAKEQVEVSDIDENGNEVKSTVDMYTMVADPNAQFSIYFDEQTSKLWEHSMDYNWALLTGVEESANILYHKEGRGGYLMLRDVLKLLGMADVIYQEEYKHFLLAGWVEGHGDDRVEFRAKEVTVNTHDRFGNPIQERKILLDFNCNPEPVYMNL